MTVSKKNAFESGELKVIPAVLLYAQQGSRTLMIHRNARDKSEDYHSGKWNGLGGKCEPGESPLETAQRELFEESGLNLQAGCFEPAGVLQFPLFKPKKNEDWWVTVFRVNVPEAALASLIATGPEGDLHWVENAKLLELRLWEGDKLFLPLVLQKAPFLGSLWYEGETVSRFWVTKLSA